MPISFQQGLLPTTPAEVHTKSMQDTVGGTRDACTQAKKGGKGPQHGCPQSGLEGKKGTSKTRKFTDKIKQPFRGSPMEGQRGRRDRKVRILR